MKPTELLQEIRKMRFEEAYGGWEAGRLSTAAWDMRADVSPLRGGIR